MRKASFLLRQNGRLCIIGRNLLQRCILKTSDFYYDLPRELIAQTPAPVRSQSRLLIYNRSDGSVTDGVFTDVLDHLHPGDVLVRNICGSGADLVATCDGCATGAVRMAVADGGTHAG